MQAPTRGSLALGTTTTETVYFQLKAEGKIDDPVYMKKWLNDPDNRFFRVRPGQL